MDGQGAAQVKIVGVYIALRSSSIKSDKGFPGRRVGANSYGHDQ